MITYQAVSNRHANLPNLYANLPIRYANSPNRYANLPNRYANLPNRYANLPNRCTFILRHNSDSSYTMSARGVYEYSYKTVRYQ